VKFADLLLREHDPVTISALYSPRNVRIHLPEDIASIRVADEGVTLWRRGITDAEKALAETGRNIIIKRSNGTIPHQVIQDKVWKNKQAPSYVKDETAKTVKVDYHTSPEGEGLRGRYDGTAAVIYDSPINTFRFDGLDRDPAADAQAVYDFLTHFHSDHANAGGPLRKCPRRA
jgi:hypothetical protein